MSMLTVAWTRAENAAYLPEDSGIVFPKPSLTVAWRPMLNSAVLDWEPADLLVTPGAGADPVVPPDAPPPRETGAAPGEASPRGDKPTRRLGAPDIRVGVRRPHPCFAVMGCRSRSSPQQTRRSARC